MSVMKLYATNNVSQDAAASLDAPDDGYIEGVLLSLACTGIADASVVRMEVSFASTSAFSANDTRAAIAGMTFAYEFTTSGGSASSQVIFVPMHESCAAGERIYLHIAITNAAIWIANAFLYTDYKMSKPSPRRVR